MMNTVDWDKVRRIMERSIRGTRPTDDEADLLDDAWKGDVEKYRKIHDEVRAEAHEEMRRW